MLESEKIKDFVDAMFLPLWLEKQGFMLIFVDEFHVNMTTSNLWNWSRRGMPALLSVDPNSWTMSFVLAFSKNKIEGIMASDHSIYSKTFWKFIKDVYVSIKNDDEESANPWFIMDNWSVHTSNESIETFKNLRAMCVLIPPYSPQLNPAEIMIARIKGEIRQNWITSKPLSLQLVKRIVDKITPYTW